MNFSLKTGLYDASLEKDACGVGFLVNIAGNSSSAIVANARSVLCNMTHRGGFSGRDGDGAGWTFQFYNFKRCHDSSTSNGKN